MEATLAQIENAVVVTNTVTPVDVIAETLNKLDFMATRIRQLKADLEAKMVERIQETGEDIEIGPIRYYVGVEKKTRCRDLFDTTDNLLAVVAGDMRAFADCLSANAYKYGHVRALLGRQGVLDLYDTLFETVEVDELREGKPKRRLQKVNTEYAGR